MDLIEDMIKNGKVWNPVFSGEDAKFRIRVTGPAYAALCQVPGFKELADHTDHRINVHAPHKPEGLDKDMVKYMKTLDSEFKALILTQLHDATVRALEAEFPHGAKNVVDGIMNYLAQTTSRRAHKVQRSSDCQPQQKRQRVHKMTTVPTQEQLPQTLHIRPLDLCGPTPPSQHFVPSPVFIPVLTPVILVVYVNTSSN